MKSILRVCLALSFVQTFLPAGFGAADKQAPSVPGGLTASGVTSTEFAVSWTACTDNVGVTGYEVFLGGVSQGTNAMNSRLFTARVPSTAYVVTVRARDKAGNWSAQSAPLAVTTAAGLPDTAPPSTPGGLGAASVTASGFTVSWQAASDNVAVTRYEVYLDGVSRAQVSGTTTTLSGLVESTAYRVNVRAGDAAGNWSSLSQELVVTTSPDTTAIANASLSVGLRHVIVVKSDGSAWSWGSDPSSVGHDPSAFPQRLDAVTGAKSAAAGMAHSLVLLQNGSVLGFGTNNYNAIADGKISTPISGLSGIISVAAGNNHSLAVKSDGTLWAWGYNASGQVGNGKTTTVSSPTKVTKVSGVVEVAAGLGYSVARKSDGTVLAWGGNAKGQVGNGTTANQLAPLAVSGLSGVTALSSRWEHTLALKSNGTVWAWGANEYGQLGDGSTINRLRPVQVVGLSGVVAIATGIQHSLALKADGTVWAWGAYSQRQLGDGSRETRLVPVLATIVPSAARIAAGADTSFAVTPDGLIRSWGSVACGLPGQGNFGTQEAPISDIVRISGHYGFVPDPTIMGSSLDSCVYLLRRDGTVSAWGANFEGWLADGTQLARGEAVTIAGLQEVVQVERGIARLRDGTVRTWGSNRYGQLGDGSTVERYSPGPVPGLSGVVQVAAGDYHYLALRNDGTVWAWGANDYAQLGDGSAINRRTPAQVAGLSNIIWIAAGGNNSCAIRSDGTGWSWGGNWWTSGTGGGSAPIQIPTQVLVGNLTSVSIAAEFPNHAMFLTRNGRVFVCGQDDLGVGPWYGSTSPLEVPGLENIVEVAASGAKTARAADGTVWQWSSTDRTVQIQPRTGIVAPASIVSASGFGAVYAGGAYSALEIPSAPSCRVP